MPTRMCRPAIVASVVMSRPARPAAQTLIKDSGSIRANLIHYKKQVLGHVLGITDPSTGDQGSP